MVVPVAVAAAVAVFIAVLAAAKVGEKIKGEMLFFQGRAFLPPGGCLACGGLASKKKAATTLLGRKGGRNKERGFSARMPISPPLPLASGGKARAWHFNFGYPFAPVRQRGIMEGESPLSLALKK